VFILAFLWFQSLESVALDGAGSCLTASVAFFIPGRGVTSDVALVAGGLPYLEEVPRLPAGTLILARERDIAGRRDHGMEGVPIKLDLF
jgi:hypothetical protein